MAKKILSIVDKAYRAVTEEQDDTIVWIQSALKAAGADISLLLKGNAVNYLDKGQETPPVCIGNWQQSHPAQLSSNIELLIKKNVSVFYVKEDLQDRGIEIVGIISDAEGLSKSGLAKFYSSYDLVFQW